MQLDLDLALLGRKHFGEILYLLECRHIINKDFLSGRIKVFAQKPHHAVMILVKQPHAFEMLPFTLDFCPELKQKPDIPR